MDTITAELFRLQDTGYAAMQVRIIPTVSADRIIGVRTPALRALAKELARDPGAASFLSSLPHRYFDENQLHAFVISLEKDFDTCVAQVEAFLPYIDNWATCDQLSPKAFKKDHQKLLPYIKKWISSEHVYTARFGLRMLMNEFLGEDFREEYLELAAQKKGEDYYLKMMIAWFFATALAKRYDETVKYFENRRLDEWVHKKAIQKATESFRVTDEHKEYLRSLR